MTLVYQKPRPSILTALSIIDYRTTFNLDFLVMTKEQRLAGIRNAAFTIFTVPFLAIPADVLLITANLPPELKTVLLASALVTEAAILVGAAVYLYCLHQPFVEGNKRKRIRSRQSN